MDGLAYWGSIVISLNINPNIILCSTNSPMLQVRLKNMKSTNQWKDFHEVRSKFSLEDFADNVFVSLGHDSSWTVVSIWIKLCELFKQNIAICWWVFGVIRIRVGPNLNLGYYLKTQDYTLHSKNMWKFLPIELALLHGHLTEWRLQIARGTARRYHNCRKNHFARQGQGHTTVNESVILLNLQHGSQDWEVGGVSIFLDLKCAQSNTMQHPT